MNVLILGGTGLISVGIVKHLLTRGARVCCLNRGQTPAKDVRPLPDDVEQVHADRNDVPATLAAVDGRHFDATIDMCAFTLEQGDAGLALARHVSSGHHLFCSTVCTYGVKIPPDVVIDETLPQQPISDYGRNKLTIERRLLDQNDVPVTVVRPSHTYGEGAAMIDQLEYDPPTWGRMLAGRPVLIADGGLGLWNSTHRDDVGALFAYAAGREATFGKAYNATIERTFTWRDLYRKAADALGVDRPEVYSLPADWLIKRGGGRFVGLAEIFRFHGPYTSRLARQDVPEFDPQISFRDGAERTFDHLRATDSLKLDDDGLTDRIIEQARGFGVQPLSEI